VAQPQDRARVRESSPAQPRDRARVQESSPAQPRDPVQVQEPSPAQPQDRVYPQAWSHPVLQVQRHPVPSHPVQRPAAVALAEALAP
jgi:hypothetical protein